MESLLLLLDILTDTMLCDDCRIVAKDCLGTLDHMNGYYRHEFCDLDPDYVIWRTLLLLTIIGRCCMD